MRDEWDWEMARDYNTWLFSHWASKIFFDLQPSTGYWWLRWQMPNRGFWPYNEVSVLNLS